jgi:Sulfatase
VKADQANAISFAKNLLLAISLVTLAAMVPLNSVILANPDESLCLLCLVTVYAVSIAFIFLWLSLSENIWGGKLYCYSLNTFTVVALIFFFSAIQVATVTKAWRTPYVILCVFFLLFLFWSFFRKGKQAAHLFLMFALVLSLYESVNLVRIVSRDIALSSLGSRPVEAPPQKRPGTNLPHVFVLLFDELSLVHVLKDELLDRDVIPNLTQFSGSATWYRKAVTPYAFTSYAIPALLTGRIDVGTFRQAFLEQTTNPHLFRVAATTHDIYISGYYSPYCEAFRVYVSGCQSLTQGFSDYGSLFRTWWDRAVPGELRHWGLAQSVRDTLAGYSDPSKLLTEALRLGQDFSRPTLTYIHLGLPHKPFMFRANGDVRLGVAEFNFNSMTQEELLKVRDVYREQVAYTDKLFGVFLAQLKELDVYDRSVIVVTSDHGISFDKAHPWRSQAWIDFEEIARVPLLVKMPGQHMGRIDDRRMLNIELYQIILNVLDQRHQASEGISKGLNGGKEEQ